MLPLPELDFRRTPVTLFVAAVAVAIELVCTYDPARREIYRVVWKLEMLSPVWSGEVWRPITTTILHGGVLHVAFNVYWLLTFGRVLEPYFGSARYAGVLLLLACCATMPAFLLNNLTTELDAQRNGVGLSGVIYGMFGILMIGQNHRRDFYAACPPELSQFFIAWFFFCFALTYLNIWPIDNYAHAAGWVFGMLLGNALFATRQLAVWRGAAALFAVVSIVSIVYAPGHPLYEKYRQRMATLRQAERLIEELENRPLPIVVTLPDAEPEQPTAEPDDNTKVEGGDAEVPEANVPQLTADDELTETLP